MINIGEIVRVNREEQGISQEELCFGICSVSNLSRIENGTQIPSRATYEALMQRMGLPPEIYPSFLNERELETYRLKHEINEKFKAGKYDESEILLDKLENAPKLERIYRQFAMFVRAILLRKNNGDPADVLEAMKQVVEASVKDFEPKRILRYVLTKDEMNMLNNLATSYYESGDQSYGIEILYAIKDYIERRVVDNKGISPTYTTILFNLSNWVGLKGRYKEVLKLCDIGIPNCIEYGSYFSFAGLLFNKGYALVMLDRKEEAQKYIQEAYYIDRARNELSLCEITKNFADEHGIII